jgi:outer membrane protein assembly factor BamB
MLIGLNQTVCMFKQFIIMLAAAGPAAAQNVVTYHNSESRLGAYRVPGLTTQAAASMRLDGKFSAQVSGNIYAQPLYWHPNGAPAELIVATENNIVYALDPASGAVLWQTALPAPVPVSQLACGDIDPEGITGTPVIDPASGTLYFDSLSAAGGTVQHGLYAIAASNGAVLTGWPVNVQAALAAQGVTLMPKSTGERSALLMLDGKLYAAYGGRAGDCQPYNGTVIEVDPATRSLTGWWQTRAAGGGIWSQGGIAAAGGSLFIATGNTSATTKYGDGESVVRLKPGLARSSAKRDYYAPANWHALDQGDLDLGGTEALPVNLANGNGQTAPSVIAFGKDGNAYLLNRDDLGGIGGAATILQVASGHIITAPAVYGAAGGDMVAITNTAPVGCPGNNQGTDVIMMLKMAPGGSAPISVAWCGHYTGNGLPIITTTDGTDNPIVWVASGELYGFDALTGARLSTGHGGKLAGVNRFATIVAAARRLYVAADNAVYAFTFTNDR